MTVSQHLVEGGIPRDWTPLNLAWLAETHRRVSQNQNTRHLGVARAEWHRRWATFCEDLLETHRVHDH